MSKFLDPTRKQSQFVIDDSDDDFTTRTEEDRQHGQYDRSPTSRKQQHRGMDMPGGQTAAAELHSTAAVGLSALRKSVVGGSVISTTDTVYTEASTAFPMRGEDDDDDDDDDTIIHSTTGGGRLTEEDLELCQRLDEEYERALEEREIGYNASYASVRQSAVLSVCFMIAFLGLGTAFFMRQAAWTIPESILFCIFTITTVGYGREEIPTTPGFQAYTIFYILVGIAALTIMVAQVYQCIALEASRAQHARDKTEMVRRGLDVIVTNGRQRANTGTGVGAMTSGSSEQDEIIDFHTTNVPALMDQFFRLWDRTRLFFRTNEIGRGISVLFPFAGLILVGALIVGPIEGWTFLEALYFAVVSLTTVGYGDYVPTNDVSIIFCIIWLPFSVGFMSLYLGSVAAFYIRLSDRNIQRIEKQIRRRLQRAKDMAELEKADVLRRAYRGQEVQVQAAAANLKDRDTTNRTGFSGNDNMNKPSSASSINIGSIGIPVSHAQSLARKLKNVHGFDALPTGDGEGSEFGEVSDSLGLFGSSPVSNGLQRRQRVIENCAMRAGSKSDGATMQSMKDVVSAVRRNLDPPQNDGTQRGAIRSGPDVQYMSIRSTQTITTHNGVLRRIQTRKPSFALRVLVQERFAEIIAIDIAGYHSAIEIKDTTLSVTIDSLKETADKWLVPRRARRPFRAVAFEVLYFVGERGLITRGADALFELSPVEFHALFSPLVAAMGDADTMEGWLASTDVLADADLARDGRTGHSPVADRVVENLNNAGTQSTNDVPSEQIQIPKLVPKVPGSSGSS